MRAGSGTCMVSVTAGLITAWVMSSSGGAQVPQSAAPCTTAALACTEWVNVAAERQRLLVYRSYPLDMRNERITRAFVLVHGGGRNAVDSFNTALGAAFLAGALEDTVLVSPRFASNTGDPSNSTGAPCRDTLATDEANWICEDSRPDSWRNGSGAIGNEKITSFDFADEILRKLARKDVFPNLKGIVLGGHSGGGQFTIRYAMANQTQDRLGVPVTYVVSNPDALVYLDPLRPTAAAYPPAASVPGYVLTAPIDRFEPFADAGHCATYNNWQYGLQGRTGYAAQLSDEQLKKQITARAVTYLLGGLDILPILGFDSSCPAMAQGPTRLARGIAFSRYMNERYGARHESIVVPSCGHNDRCMFTANAALPLIFPKH